MRKTESCRSPHARPCFLVFSDDWGEHPSSCQHLFRIIGRSYPTLWVNTIGMRSMKPTWDDAKRAARKVRRMFPPHDRHMDQAMPAPTVAVCQPPMLPFVGSALCRRINRISVVRGVRKRLSALGMANPILVTTVPNAADYVGAFGERRVVYYCVDDFSEWPGFKKALIQGMEKTLISQSHVLIATSRKLMDKFSGCHRPRHLLTHGVDLAHFSRLPAGEHPALGPIPRPRVGYFGLFDKRSDQELISGVARRLPDVSFVIAGPLDVDVSTLSRMPNIFFTGSVPYSALPAMVAGWDACILPYVQNALTAAINPLKLKEYLATGRPVISTPIPEARRVEAYLTLAGSVDEFAAAIRASLALKPGGVKGRLQALLAHAAWPHKASRFVAMATGTAD